jgi:ElaA protein
MSKIVWNFYSWNELDTQILYSLLKLRQDVFIIEQNCPYPDLDIKDQKAIHVVARIENSNVCLAYARIFAEGDYFELPSIGRVCTHLEWRKKGLGKELMTNVMTYIKAHFPGKQIKISAQSYLLKFYSNYGFKAQGDEYLEDDIPHYTMYCQLS